MRTAGQGPSEGKLISIKGVGTAPSRRAILNQIVVHQWVSSQAKENQKWLSVKITAYQKKEDMQVKTVL